MVKKQSKKSHVSLSQLAKKGTLRIAGLMSGTSADGVDVAIIDFGPAINILAFDTYPYPASVSDTISKIVSGEKLSAGEFCHLNFAIGEVFADAVLRICKSSRINLDSIDLIGSHGQTIYHNPAGTPFGKKLLRSTLQIGESALIAQRTGKIVVADFRPADVAAGGQGAPLVPYADYILFSHKNKNRIIQNIGGIANLTWLKANGRLDDILAFDTGPGNMIIDHIAHLVTGGKLRYDVDGRIAAKGAINKTLLKKLMQHKFIKKSPSKTTGREEFGSAFSNSLFHNALKAGIKQQDILATVTAFTAQSIIAAYKRFLPSLPDEVILCGGGVRNKTLVKMLRDGLKPAAVLTTDKLGINADAKEAISFAILAAQTVRGIPNNVPSATGAEKPVVLGKIISG
jgi:anhydro-N-acetylmuramic acid kinase